MTNKTIKICEGTTHYLNIDCCHDGSKNEYDLTDDDIYNYHKNDCDFYKKNLKNDLTNL